MEDDLSGIYDDLENTDLGTQILNLQERNNSLEKHIETLENHVHTLKKEVNELKTTQENLKKNISELFNTAKAEIARKDRTIAELRQELDDVILRRFNRADRRKRPIEEDVSFPRSSHSTTKRTKHSGVSEDRHIADVRRGSSSDDSRYKADRRRDDRSRDYRSRDRPSYHESIGHRENSRHRDARHRDSSKDRRHHRTGHYKDGHKNLDDPRRNCYERRIENKNHKEIKPSTPPNNEITDKIAGLEDKLKREEINVLEAEDQGHICNTTDAVSIKDDSSSKDSHLSKVDLEAYVKLERTLELDVKDDSPKEEVKKVSESWEDDKLLIVEETDGNKSTNLTNEFLSTSSQELQNAINSINNDPFETKVKEASTSIEVNVIRNSTDNVDTNISMISIDNVKSNDSATSSSNKSFRSRRRRCVITVNE